VNKHQAPTQISLTTITSRPSLIRDFGSRNFAIPVVEFLGPLPPKPKYRFTKMFGHILLHSRITFRDFGNPGTKNPYFSSSKCQMSNPDVSSKDWLPNMGLFIDSEFQTSRLRNPDARLPLSNLRNPEIVNEVLTPPGNKYATYLLHCLLYLTWILATYHSNLSSFRDLNDLPTVVRLHSGFTNPDLPK
jgi:hypothetical protein